MRLPKLGINCPFLSDLAGHLSNWGSSDRCSWDNNGPSKDRNEETARQKWLWSWMRGKKSPDSFALN